MRGVKVAALVLALGLLTVALPTTVAAQSSSVGGCSYDGAIEFINCLTPGASDADDVENPIQRLIFFGFLPFILVFALFYYMARHVVGEREALLIAIALSGFFVASGGNVFVAEFFLEIFGMGSGGFDIPSIGGDGSGSGDGGIGGMTLSDIADKLPFISEAYEAQILLTLLIVILVALPLGSGMYGDSGFSGVEYLILLMVGFGVWMALGGIGQILNVLMWIIVLSVGLGLIEVWRRTGGLAGIGAGLAGLIVVGWGLTTLSTKYGFIPAVAGDFGSKILQGVAGMVIVVLIGIGVFLYIISQVYAGGSSP